jgi:hypothetical protein
VGARARAGVIQSKAPIRRRRFRTGAVSAQSGRVGAQLAISSISPGSAQARGLSTLDSNPYLMTKTAMRIGTSSSSSTSRHLAAPSSSSGFSLILITAPDLPAPNSRQFDAELAAVRALFSEAGLRRLHLRKPGADPSHVAEYLARLEPEHRRRVVVHGAAVRGAALSRAVAPFAETGELAGVHYREADRAESAGTGHAFLGDGGDGRRLELLRSSGYHSLAAVIGCGQGDEDKGGEAAAATATAAAGGGEQQQQQQPPPLEPWPPAAYLDYCFLSPVYDSISKAGYRSAGFLCDDDGGGDEGGRRAGSGGGRRLAAALARAPLPVLALGGVAPGKLRELRAAGFAGAAVLGAVWQADEGPVEAYRALEREAAQVAGGQGGG